jgi:hypothetical protein
MFSIQYFKGVLRLSAQVSTPAKESPDILSTYAEKKATYEAIINLEIISFRGAESIPFINAVDQSHSNPLDWWKVKQQLVVSKPWEVCEKSFSDTCNICTLGAPLFDSWTDCYQTKK